MADTFVSYTDLLASAVQQRERDDVYSRRMCYAAQKVTDTEVACTTPVSLDLTGVKQYASGITQSTTTLTVPTGGDGLYYLNFSCRVRGTDGQVVTIDVKVGGTTTGFIGGCTTVTADLHQTVHIEGMIVLAEAAALTVVIDEAADGTINLEEWNIALIRVD